MTDEEIFDLAERHGWQDDFGRWNFRDDGLIGFALALLKAENVSVNTPSSDDLPETEEGHAIDMSEKDVQVSDKWVGLTDAEIKALSSWWPSYDQMPALMRLVRDIEAKLKEKNT